MKIWVDDIRNCPKDYDYWCKSTNDTIKLLDDFRKQGLDVSIEILDLDHDAGDYEKYGGDYIKVIDWMVENNFSCPVRLHTGNPVGRKNMLLTMDRYGIPEVKYEWDELF